MQYFCLVYDKGHRTILSMSFAPIKYTEREIYDNTTDVYYMILINIVDTILVPDYHAPQKKLGCAHDMTMFSVQ